jgi:hypothetical protein
MIKENELLGLLIFDLETVPEYASYQRLIDANPKKAKLWEDKFNKQTVKNPTEWTELYDSYKFASLFPEYGKIVCASFCFMQKDDTNLPIGDTNLHVAIKSFNIDENTSEREVLEGISTLLFNLDAKGIDKKLCGHNIKKFDIPWLVKRMILNNVAVPPQLQLWGKKPWEINHVDTGELWTLGNWDGYVSLDLLTNVLDLPSPKAEMHGSRVGEAFWVEKNYDKIKLYCEQDVVAVARICHKLSNTKASLNVD